MVNEEFKSNLLNALRDPEVRDAVLDLVKENIAIDVIEDTRVVNFRWVSNYVFKLKIHHGAGDLPAIDSGLSIYGDRID